MRDLTKIEELDRLLSNRSGNEDNSCDVRAVLSSNGFQVERERTVQNRLSRKRSIVKAITYRGIIICLDFLVIFLLTGKVMTAAVFMIVSNIYTTAAYFFHERAWAGIKWGIEPQEGS